MPFTSNFTSLSGKKIYKPFLLALSGIILTYPTAGFCGRDVLTFPFHEDFDSDNYQDIVWTNGGAQHEWVSHGGWQGSGGAKFYPPTQDDKYCALGQFTEFNNHNGSEQVNVRFLIYHGPEFYNLIGYQKLLVLNRNGVRQRPMIGGKDYEGQFRAYAPCDNTLCRFYSHDENPQVGWWPGPNEPLKIAPGPDSRSEEWISVELEANMMTGIIKVYVDTQDGELSGLYRELPFLEAPVGGAPFSHIDVIGGYFNTGNPHDPEKYFIIDELEINNSYIGPPDGFVQDVVPNKLSVDLNGETVSTNILSYGGSDQDIQGTAYTEDNGTVLSLSGNVWKKVDLGNLVIGPNTMLEFDFSSNSQGEIHGIGFDNDNEINSGRTFKLYGTQHWGISSEGRYSGSGQEHFVIPVGGYYSGAMRWLTFVNDHDEVATPSAESRFSNIRVYEAGN
ncbi:MAG: hypothetical protein P8163_13305 [Candidatus Thiodiazotropha sp.]